MSLQSLLRGREFIVSVQIDQPDDSDPERIWNISDALLDLGVKTVDINSSGHGIKYDSLSVASSLNERFVAIPHITSRDSLISGVLRQFLASYALWNVRQVLVITGDPRTDSARGGVYEGDSITLIAALKKLRTDKKMDFMIGCAFDQTKSGSGPFADNFDIEFRRLINKRHAGADFIMTQPIWRIEDWLVYEDAIIEVGLPVMVGVWPIFDRGTDGRKLGTLERIFGLGPKKIIGVVMPPDIFEKFKNCADLTAVAKEHALSLVNDLKTRSRASGIYMVAPFRNNNFADFYDLLRLINKK